MSEDQKAAAEAAGDEASEAKMGGKPLTRAKVEKKIAQAAEKHLAAGERDAVKELNWVLRLLGRMVTPGPDGDTPAPSDLAAEGEAAAWFRNQRAVGTRFESGTEEGMVLELRIPPHRTPNPMGYRMDVAPPDGGADFLVAKIYQLPDHQTAMKIAKTAIG